MKDYYAVLGVVPTAEDVVIRAAYKALAQRYHPDRHPGDKADASARMAEINEAYGVLSDPEKRRQYDSSRPKGESDFDAWTQEETQDQAEQGDDPLAAEWNVAVSYFPDLADINRRLKKISHLLAFTFRATLLEMKAFDKRHELAKLAESEFLKSYFGSDPKILEFARFLILNGEKKAAKALNEAVRVLGSKISASLVIDKVCDEFNVITPEKKASQAKEVEAEEKRKAQSRTWLDENKLALRGKTLTSQNLVCPKCAKENKMHLSFSNYYITDPDKLVCPNCDFMWDLKGVPIEDTLSPEKSNSFLFYFGFIALFSLLIVGVVLLLRI